MNWIEKIEFFRIYNQPIARESTNIDKMSYDDIKKELVIQFQGGATYTYSDVPLEIYKDVVNGKATSAIGDNPSVGAAVHKYLIKAGFGWEIGGTVK
jgi:hypothetical protein